MAIFSTIANIANKIIRFVDDRNDSNAHVNVSSNPNAILSFEEGKPVDEINISSKGKNSVETEMEIRKYQSIIFDKCRNTGLKAGEILDRLLKYSCMTPLAYNSLSNEEKLILWHGFTQIVESAIGVKEKYGVSQSADANKVINQMLDVYQANQSHGNIIHADDVLELAGDINGELKDKNIADKSREEKFGIFGKIFNAVAEKFKSFEEKELKGLDGDIKAHRTQFLERIKDKAEKMRLLQLNMVQDPETAYFGLLGVSAKQLAWGTRALLDSRISKDEMIKVADNIMTFDNQANIIEAHCTRGDKPSKEIVRDMTMAAVSEMSEQGIKAYSQSYDIARTNGSHPLLKENGYYTEIAGGIGAGAILNQNMSENTKQQFMNEFLKNEEKFGDVEEVKQAIKSGIENYISEYTKTHTEVEVATLKTKLETCQKQIVEKISESTIKDNNEDSPSEIINEKKQSSNITSSFTKEDSEGTSKLNNVKKDNEVTGNTKLNYTENKYKLNNVDEIRRNVNSGLPLCVVKKISKPKEFAKFCIINPIGNTYLSQINNIITTTKPSELATWNANISGYNYIVKTLSPDKAEEYIKLKPMTILVKELAQKNVEKRQEEQNKDLKNENAAC